MKPDPEELEAVVIRLNKAIIAGCAGGIEVENVDDAGVVSVRLDGMCSGCSCRALTIATSIRPAIEAIDGVTRLHVANSGISRYAEERIAEAFSRRRSHLSTEPKSPGAHSPQG